MEDERIIELYWQRDEAAIRETEVKYGAYCRSIAVNLLEKHEDAEECVSDTWLSAWNAMPPQRPEHLRIFLGRITRNGAIDRLRELRRLKRGGGRAPLPLDELAECVPAPRTAESQLEDIEIARVISVWLRTLSAEKRQLFVRRYWHFDSEAALCSRFGISRSKAASTLYRLRLELKAKLESEGITL